MTRPVRILGIAGSLRRDSYNRSALEAARELAPPGVEVEIFDLAGIPFFSEDDEGAPDPRVLELRAAIRSADALLIATPEYNYSVPGVLKNAIDWASRPYGQSAFAGKPAAILSASSGSLGGIRAQFHLRQILVSQDMQVLNQPEIVIGNAGQRFDAAGRLADPGTRALLQAQLKALAGLAAPARDGEARNGAGRQRPDQTRGVVRPGRASGSEALNSPAEAGMAG